MGAIGGIDLGTTYSALATLNDIGKPEIVPDLNGNRITPSVVAFEDESSVVVGLEAKNKLSSNPANVVQFVKRKMGDPSHTYEVNGNSFNPIKTSSFILKRIKENCLHNGSEEVQDVIITVPAHFNEIERKSTMDAGQLAGFNVLGVVNEPTAAALYYATQSPLNGNIVVYDLGGGTFDVTVLNRSGETVDILSSKGHGHLGGVDFDNELTRYLVKKAREEFGCEFFPDHFFDAMPCENSDELQTYFKIMELAERAKKQLSAREETRANIKLEGRNFSASVHRQDFEEMISSHLSATEMLLENALEDANLSAKDIDKVILVGGSTRIPKVAQLLEDFFGFPPTKEFNPDEVVALGAAIMAAKRKLKQSGGAGVSAAVRAEVSKTSVLECATSYFGTISVGLNEARGEKMHRNTIIIEAGAKIPCEKMEEFCTTADCQEEIRVRVTESAEKTYDVKDVREIAEWSLKLPPNCPQGSPIDITFGYTEDQRLKVRVVLPDGKVFEADIHQDSAGNLNQSDMKEAAADVGAFTVE